MKAKRTKLFWLYVICAVIILLFTIPYFFWVEEWDYKLLLEAAFLFLTCVVSAWFEKDKPSVKKRDKYEEAYRKHIEGAFAEDKKSYRKLIDVLVFYDQNHSKKALKNLHALEKKCVRARDYVTVYFFEGLCYEDMEQNEQSVAAYEKAIHYDMTNSSAWSNLGMRYLELDRRKDAYTAYSNAILYDAKNPWAHCNMACLLIDEKEPQLALEHALMAAELNANMPQAMSAVAVSYKMLGDEQNARKYRNMYGMNGGNVKDLDVRFAMVEEEMENDA